MTLTIDRFIFCFGIGRSFKNFKPQLKNNALSIFAMQMQRMTAAKPLTFLKIISIFVYELQPNLSFFSVACGMPCYIFFLIAADCYVIFFLIVANCHGIIKIASFRSDVFFSERSRKSGRVLGRVRDGFGPALMKPSSDFGLDTT